MRKRSAPAFRPLSALAVSEISEQGVQLRSAREVVEFCVLAPDLFRLRIAKGRKFSKQPSWAVVKNHREPLPVKIQVGQRQLSIMTHRGSLLLRPTDGSWKLLDSAGNEVFATASKA